MRIFIDCINAVRLAVKARILWVAAGVMLVLLLATNLSAYFGGRQPVTVAMDVGFSVIRLLMPLLIVLLAQELFTREFDKRYYLNSLSYPRGRTRFLFGRFFSMILIVVVLLLIFSVGQVFLVSFVGAFYPQATPVSFGSAYFFVVAFIAIDMFFLVSLAVLLAIVGSTPSFVLVGTFGVMLVARSYGAVVELLGNDFGLISNAERYRSSLGSLGYLLPDLGALDIRMLALYGKPEFLPADWPLLLLSSLAYSIALLALAIWALQRRRFA